VRAEEAADFFRSVGRSDELFFGWSVDTVVARRDRRWTTDADVDFGGAGFAYHANDFARGGAANDGVVDQNDALALDEAAHRVELKLDAEVADRLRGLDEGAADVVISY